MAYKITLIPGDGIGPEVTQATVRILEATGVKFDWEIFQAGAEAFEKYHEYIPKELIESIERTRVGLKGPVTTPVGEGFPSINVALAQEVRALRQLPSHSQPASHSDPLSRRRSDHRARKHREPVFRASSTKWFRAWSRA